MPRHIVAYHSNRYVDHFRRDLEEMRAHGFNTVVHCVTEADLEWGMARVGELFAATREAGFECWADPWAFARVFGGEAHSGFLASGQRPCMDNPAFAELIARFVDGVADAGAEAIFWDEPNLATCGCCEERVIEFLDHWTGHAAARGLGNSVCFAGLGVNKSRVLEAAALPAVTDIGASPYLHGPHDPDVAQRVGEWAELVRDAAAAHGRTAHVWVQGFDLPAGYEHLFVEAAAAARARGVHDIAFWSYRATEATSRIAPDDPQLVWRMARDVFAGALTA